MLGVIRFKFQVGVLQWECCSGSPQLATVNKEVLDLCNIKEGICYGVDMVGSPVDRTIIV